jgi:hypothetical protein
MQMVVKKSGNEEEYLGQLQSLMKSKKRYEVTMIAVCEGYENREP